VAADGGQPTEKARRRGTKSVAAAENRDSGPLMMGEKRKGCVVSFTPSSWRQQWRRSGSRMRARRKPPGGTTVRRRNRLPAHAGA